MTEIDLRLSGFDDAALAEAKTRLAAIVALHQPYYTAAVGGVQRTYTVQVGCEDFPCDGDYDRPCAEAAADGADADGWGEHDVPACRVCGGWTDDGHPGSVLHPCPTLRAALGTFGAGEPHEVQQ